MHYLRYSLAHRPGISSNITNSTHFRAPPTLSTLVQNPYQPRKHVTHANTPPMLARHTCHPHKHTTHTTHPTTPQQSDNTIF